MSSNELINKISAWLFQGNWNEQVGPLLCNIISSLVIFESWLRGYIIDFPFKAELSELFYSLYLGQVWISVLITIYYRKKFL